MPSPPSCVSRSAGNLRRGAISGAFGYHLYMASPYSHNLSPATRAHIRVWPDPKRYGNGWWRMRQRVKLDDAQIAKLNGSSTTRGAVRPDHREMNDRGHAAWDKQVAEVKAILRPEQELFTISCAPNTKPPQAPPPAGRRKEVTVRSRDVRERLLHTYYLTRLYLCSSVLKWLRSIRL